MKYPGLFASMRLGKLVLPNRVVMPPMTTGYAHDGFVTDRMIDYYAARAAGGAGLVIVEDCIIDAPRGNHGLNDVFIDDDRFLPGLHRLARAIKDNGAVAAIQLNHAGRVAGKLKDGRLVLTDGQAPVAPSAIAFHADGFAVPRELTVPEIEAIEDGFAAAARRAGEAGFDIVSLHCSHQYLIEQFLSPFSNRRQDAYGGDFDGRLRFLLEIIGKVRQNVGQDFPVICRISGVEHREGGLTVGDAVKIARRLESAGVSALNVSHGANPNGLTADTVAPLTAAPKREQRGELVHLAVPIKQAVSIPVMTVGRIITPQLAEEILKQGKADLICIGRGLIADPDWPVKAREGREKEIRHCIACEHCFSSVRGEPLSCAVNPAAGNEAAFRLTPAAKVKTVLVAGGGPAGMEAARVAALRGHKVRLFEKDRIGGQLNLACLPPGKDEFELFLQYETEQLNKLGIKVENQELDVDIVRKEQPGAVIVATGAIPEIPGLPGIDRDGVVTAWQVLRGDMPRGKNIAVIGGGMTGAETAELLAINDNSVTIVEQLSEIAADGAHLPFYHLALLKTLGLLGAEIITGAAVEAITGEGVVVQSGEHRLTIGADIIVLALGVRPDDALARRLERLGIELHVVGDCGGVGQMPKAVREGYLAGLEL